MSNLFLLLFLLETSSGKRKTNEPNTECLHLFDTKMSLKKISGMKLNYLELRNIFLLGRDLLLKTGRCFLDGTWE